MTITAIIIQLCILVFYLLSFRNDLLVLINSWQQLIFPFNLILIYSVILSLVVALLSPITISALLNHKSYQWKLFLVSILLSSTPIILALGYSLIQNLI